MTKGLGEMIKNLREAKGLSQEDLAKRAKVTRPYITMLESGVKKNPSPTILKRLAKALEVPMVKLTKSGEILIFVGKFECDKCHQEVVLYRYDQPGVRLTTEMEAEAIQRGKQFHEQDCLGGRRPERHPITRRRH